LKYFDIVSYFHNFVSQVLKRENEIKVYRLLQNLYSLYCKLLKVFLSKKKECVHLDISNYYKMYPYILGLISHPIILCWAYMIYNVLLSFRLCALFSKLSLQMLFAKRQKGKLSDLLATYVLWRHLKYRPHIYE